MKLPALFRRRHVWVPTSWTWLVLAIALGLAALFAVRNVYAFLAPNEPVGAHLLVVEGWMDAEELDQALRALGTGRWERVLTTGGPIADFEGGDTRYYADRARDYLVRRGLTSDRVTAVRSPASAQDRSFLNAVLVRDWVASSGMAVDSVDVFSSGAHSRRSRLLYGLAFGPQVRVGILAAVPSSYEPEAWWRSSAGTEEILKEGIAWLWTELFFHPGPPGSHDERWGVTPSPQAS